jgi:hypothetical protein
VRETGYGPHWLFAAMQEDARNGSRSGRSADAAGTALPDPKPTLDHQFSESIGSRELHREHAQLPWPGLG